MRRLANLGGLSQASKDQARRPGAGTGDGEKRVPDVSGIHPAFKGDAAAGQRRLLLHHTSPVFRLQSSLLAAGSAANTMLTSLAI